MHTSHFHHHLLHGIVALAVVTGVSACGNGADEAANTDQTDTAEESAVAEETAETTSTSPTSVSAVPANLVSRIPDGRYQRIVTQADAERLGIDPALAAEAIGGEGYHVVIEIDGDRWRQLGGTNPDRLEIGDEGTSRYDADGNWVTTSESDGCPGCSATITWSLDGDTLVLAVPDDLDPIDRLMIDGTYTHATPTDGTSLTMTGFLDFVPPQVVGFLDAVDAAADPVPITTDLTIGVELSEAEVIEAVARGDVDIAFVGARAFPRFDALLAPFTVDSYALQEAVFAAGIPAAMLADLGVDGVVGIAATPGPFRKLMGVDRTIDQAGDLAGALVNTDDTQLADATFSALGATAVPGGAIDEVNAFAIQLQAIPGNGYEDDAVSVTANANMWPRPLTIIMNADAYAGLTPDQHAVLADAATGAANAATAASRAEDTEALRWICDSPMQIIQMPDAELEALRTLVDPVVADLRQDPVVASELDAIDRLKTAVGAPPDTFTCE